MSIPGVTPVPARVWRQASREVPRRQPQGKEADDEGDREADRHHRHLDVESAGFSHFKRGPVNHFCKAAPARATVPAGGYATAENTLSREEKGQ